MGRTEIDNPALGRLENLKSDVNDRLPTLRDELDSIAERIGNGSVWFGAQAREFSADLDGEKDRLKNRADDLPGDIDDKIASTPETIYVYEGNQPI
ncbi:hypothetical protein [Phytoactinopolyspora limicola]|uniref:hypothetical protein n=1 Tax=Phytoactinopolyspora limicola TaxID=2715536 RepID=UPI001409B15A|nr:hypothetical protein [Phytoactinopolyspora limicola]